MANIKRIVPCLWFDTQAEVAANYYVSIFENSRVTNFARYPEAGQETHGKQAGSVMTVAFELDGSPLTALNGGPAFKFNEAVSLQVMCETQEEIDRLWDKLSAGGDPKAQQCGWLKDKYGLSWQIVPTLIEELFAKADPQTAARVMTTFLKMKKIDIAALKAAHAG